MQRREILSRCNYFPLDASREAGERLVELRDKLRDHGYAAAPIAAKLGIASITLINRVSYNPTLFRLWERYTLDHESPLDVLIGLFFLGVPERASAVEKLFAPSEVALMVECGLLVEEPGGFSSPIALWPCGEVIVATDWIGEWDQDEKEHRETRVMFLGLDSYSLATSLPAEIAGRSLDLCTGSGILALLAARRATHAVGVDVNERAINFATFNSIFNGVTNVTFLLGDLFGALRDPDAGGYRFISANPPFVPTPHTEKLLYRSGGPTGEEILSRIVAGCAGHLDPDGGTCQIITQLIEHENRPYEEKVTRWLDGAPGFQVAILRRRQTTPVFDHALAYSSSSPCPRTGPVPAFDWVDAFRDLGMRDVGFGFILLRRSGSEGMRITRLNHLYTPPEDGASVDLSSRVWAALDRLRTTPGDRIRYRLLSPAFGPVTLSTPTDRASMPYEIAEIVGWLQDESLSVAQIVDRIDSGDVQRARVEKALTLTFRDLVVAGLLDAVVP